MSYKIKDDPGGKPEESTLQQLRQGLLQLQRSAKRISWDLGSATKALQQVSQEGGRLRRTLLSFDRLERLKAQSGSSKTQTQTPQLELGPVSSSLRKLYEALHPMTGQLFAGLQQGWEQVLKPMGQWQNQADLPGYTQKTAASVQYLSGIVGGALGNLSWLWEQFLKPMGAWNGVSVSGALENLRQRLMGIGQWVEQSRPGVDSFGGAVGTAAGQVAAMSEQMRLLQPAMVSTGSGVSRLQGLWQQMGTSTTQAADKMKTAWGSMEIWLQDNVAGGVSRSTGAMMSSMVGIFNGALAAVESGVNAAVQTLNGLRFTVPQWVPIFGGKSFDFSLKSVQLPRIPQLAQGAVLPANQPFLAVVGDQKHGTNVEAPLEVIRQAVAQVMQQQTGAILSGFADTRQVQNQILQAVLGIRIGDELIANAARRYENRQAVMTGGVL